MHEYTHTQWEDYLIFLEILNSSFILTSESSKSALFSIYQYLSIVIKILTEVLIKPTGLQNLVWSLLSFFGLVLVFANCTPWLQQAFLIPKNIPVYMECLWKLPGKGGGVDCVCGVALFKLEHWTSSQFGARPEGSGGQTIQVHYSTYLGPLNVSYWYHS